MASVLSRSHTPCPQCGAPLLVPHIAEAFSCPWCKATLQPGEAVPLHYLVERPALERAAAEQLLPARLFGPVLPQAAAAKTRVSLGDLQYLPFLRVRAQGKDDVVPLAALPAPELLQLAAVPAQLLPLGADAPDAYAPDCAQALAEALDEETLRARLREALRERAVQSLAVEYRAYFPVAFSLAGERYTAVLPGAGGDLLVERRPVRREVVGERALSLASLSLLFAEAVFLPGLWPRVAGVLLTAGALFPILRLFVARRG